ncbi:uncharacterized protein LOC143212759 [Lasioglossum baleicum]|uniref:uncharacterized protein LOC143212759 n=1 Tax=Lasioglossum baleicum TaxID=434251 RepID=UPI003FCCDC29
MYNEAMCSKSAFAVLNDSTGHSMINRTRRSPFNSASIGPMKPFQAAGHSLLNQEANFSTETAAKCSNLQNLRRDIVEPVGGGETGLERVSSYAMMIEKYSNSVNIDTLGWGRCMVPRRHVSTKLSNPSLKLEDARSGEAGARETIECSKKGISNGLTEAIAGSGSDKRQVGQAGCTIKDPERIATIKDDMDAKLQPAERADWVDRVVSAHKKSITHRKLLHTGRKTPEMDNENVARETSAHPDLEEDYPLTEMTGKKPTNPISDYIRRGPVSSNAQRGAGQASSQSSAQSSATVNPGKEPQIELRMTPSHNESVVAINVDELSARTTGAKDHLSVVISSRKNASNPANTDAQSDFGSMQISISEDTVPVKQIEFSINGKPVSELKSIVARADKLDVLSSMDKVEIRIPTKDNHARTTNQYTQHQQVARAPVNPSAILNLHINAKFNAPHVQQPKDVGVKPQSTPPASRSTPPSQAPVPPRTHNIFSPAKQEHANPDSTVATNMGRLEEQDPGENVNRGLNQSVNSGTTHSPRNSPRDSKLKNPKRDSTAENRVPSNMIPWWSSEEAFKKIKKKGSGVEGSSVVAAPNKTEDVVAEPKKLQEDSTSQPKSAVSSNPADPPKTTAPGNDATKPEVAGKSSEVMDLSPVRVTSSQRHVHGKAPKSVKHKSRMTKKVYRSRGVVRTSAIPKQSSDTQINSVPPPKVVKFVAVNPRTVDVERRPDVARADEKQRTKVEEETKKLEGDATRPGHENVQKNSDTLAKGADVERSANRSAGVSANSASGSEAAKGKSQDMSGTVENDPPGESVNGRRMKDILKTMKPIEKRKDGTLIDYGVTVPSRKPSETTLRFRVKNVRVVGRSKSIEAEKTTKKGGPDEMKEKPVGKESANSKRAARQPEVIDPVKISSVKKESLTEPKVVASQPKIVEPVKISSVKKPPEDNGAPSQPKSDDGSERISVMKKLTHRGPKNLPYVPRFNSDRAIPKKQSLLAKKDPGKLGDSLAKVSSASEKKSADTVNALATSDSKKKVQNTGDSARSLNPKEPSDKKEMRTIFLKGSEAGSRGSMTYNSQSVAKKPRIHSCPSTSRIIDRKSEKMSPENLDKHFKETGFAPFKGTIRHLPPKGNSAHFSNASEEKQATLKKDKDESGGGSTGFGNSTVGPAGLKSPRSFTMHTITSINSVTNAPVMPSIKKECKFHSVKIDNMINEPHCHPYLAVDENERPEKGLLYASWLQRFKNTVDDDKML